MELLLLLPQLLLTIGLQLALGQDAPCINSALTQMDLANQLNPRSSGDFSVLINLPFNRVFCSPLVAKYLVLGVHAERQHLRLNETLLFSGSVFADVNSMTSWRLIDVSEVSRIALFDYLIGGEFHRLAENVEYFVAMRGCNTRMCGTAGTAKFTVWRIGSQAQRNVAGVAAGPVTALLLITFAAGAFVWLYRTGVGATITQAIRPENSELTPNSLELEPVSASQHIYIKPDVREDPVNYTYDEIVDAETAGTSQVAVPSRSTTDTSFITAAQGDRVPQAAPLPTNSSLAQTAHQLDQDSTIDTSELQSSDNRSNKNDLTFESRETMNNESNRIQVDNPYAQSGPVDGNKIRSLTRK